MPLVTKNFSDIITFTRASTATYFNSAGTLTSAAVNEARLDYDPATLAARGLLIEEARTNSIRNNTMQGASAGVAPTNWTGWNITTNGVTIASSAAGTENGIAYIDVAVSGTCTLTGTAQTPSFEAATQIAATVGQTWTESVYWTLVSGSLGDSSFSIRMTETDSGGLSLTSGDSTAIIPTVGNLRSARYTFTRTTTNASTAFIVPRLRFGFVNGSTYNFTLRIGLPQMEQGAFATSVIPTTTTALTRSADVASVNTLSPWFNATESTLYLEFTPVGMKSVGGQPLVSIDNGATATERIAMIAASNNGMQNITTVAGSTSGNSTTPATIYAANTTYKVALAVKLNDIQSFVGGVAGTVGTTALMPSGLTALQFNKTFALSTSSNGWIRRFTYYPRRLSAAEGQTITA